VGKSHSAAQWEQKESAHTGFPRPRDTVSVVQYTGTGLFSRWDCVTNQARSESEDNNRDQRKTKKKTQPSCAKNVNGQENSEGGKTENCVQEGQRTAATRGVMAAGN